MPRLIAAFSLAALVTATGCYHFRFEHRDPPPGARLVSRTERAATWLNGFVGTGRVDVRRHCAEPVHTELRVTAADVLLSVVTLLIYTPHTLSVTCVAADAVPLGEGDGPEALDVD